MNKKNVTKFIALNVVSSMILSTGAWAAPIGSKRDSPQASSSRGGSSTPGSVTNRTSDVKPQNVEVSSTKPNLSCKLEPETSEYLPLNLIKQLTRDGVLPSFDPSGDNTVNVKMPAIYAGCGDIVPKLIQSKDNPGDVLVVMTIENAPEPSRVSTLKGNTYGGYIKCLENKGVVKNSEFDHTALKGQGYVTNNYPLTYKFDKEKDIKKTLKLSFGAPFSFDGGTDDYGREFGYDSDVKVGESSCMFAQKIKSEIVYLNEGEQVILQRISDTCRNGSAQKIADARRSIGNYDALKDIADKIRAQLDTQYLIKVQSDDVERITKEMDKLETQINKEKDSMDEKAAKNAIRKYSDLAKQLDEMFLNPAIKHLNDLIAQRQDMEDSPARDKLDEEIKALNESIGKFSKRNQTSFANIYGLMKKYALTDMARNIEDIRVKSYVYSRVFIGSKTDKRGAPMTFEQANQKQNLTMQKFDQTLNDWIDENLVSQGNLFPIRKTERERQAVVNRMNQRWQKYQETEAATYRKNCTGIFGASNPVQCKAFMAGAEQRRASEVRKWQADNQVVGTKNGKLERMGQNYNAFQRAQEEQRAAESDQYNPYGSSYANYDDNFGDRFPLYEAPTASASGYDAWRYSMAGQMPQMQGQQSPMMYNAQMPVQQGQFQMQQQPMMGMNGGWPSM